MEAVEKFGGYDRSLGLRGEESFMYLVEVCEGLDHLEELQKHPN